MNWIGLLSGCCVTVTVASLSPQVNSITPERELALSLYPTVTVTTAPFSPSCPDTLIHAGTPLKLQLSELVTVISSSPPSTSNVNSVGSTETEYSFATCVIIKSASLSPQENMNMAVLVSSGYGFAVNITSSPFSPRKTEASHQSHAPLICHSSELVTVTVCSPPSAPKVNSLGEIEISYTGSSDELPLLPLSSLISDFVHETRTADKSASIDNVLFISFFVLIVIFLIGFLNYILKSF